MSYVSNTPAQQREMLAACGVTSVAELFDCIPPHLRPQSFDLPPGRSELEPRGTTFI
jgi:glycine dehydrogenase subunit 1